MQYRRFGRTNLQMPVFSTGGMRYQQKWQDIPLDEVEAENQANLEATIRRSIELGINHIETARGYGSSERQLGQILPNFPRDQLIVQTKIGPSEPRKFTQEFEESLERLNLDHVDLLAIHGINDQDTLEKSLGPDGEGGGCLEAARDLQKQGKCRWVGFSTHAPLDVILDAINTPQTHHGYAGFDYVNLHWYFIFQRNWAAIEAATGLDMGVFIISPTDKGGKLYDPPAKLVELCDPLHPIVFNDLFCLMHEQVHTLSLGAARPGDYDLHLKTLKLIDHAEQITKPIIKRLAAAMKDAIGTANPEAFSWDLPDHRAAPAGLNLPLMLWLRNLAVGWDMHAYGRMRFNLMGNAGHWFPGAKPTEAIEQVSDAELLKAAMDSRIPDRIPKLVRHSVELLGGEAVKRASQS